MSSCKCNYLTIFSIHVCFCNLTFILIPSHSHQTYSPPGSYSCYQRTPCSAHFHWILLARDCGGPYSIYQQEYSFQTIYIVSVLISFNILVSAWKHPVFSIFSNIETLIFFSSLLSWRFWMLKQPQIKTCFKYRGSLPVQKYF